MSLATYDPQPVSSFWQADPAAHVWKCDPHRVWIYGSHDWNTTVPRDSVGGTYDMKDYWVLSHSDPESPPDIISKLLDLEEIPWATKQLWAPDATEKDGKYYLYFPAKDSSDIFRLGVAVSDKPDGQFVPEPSYIPGSYSIDPAVLHDEDDSYHIYFGGLSGGQLQAWNNNEFNSSAIGNFSPQPNVTAIGPRYAKLGDDLKSFEGEVKEIVLIGEDGEPMQTNNPHRFFEGPAINKIDGLYYLSYSTGPYHTIDMAVGTSVDGPFIWNSTILEPVRGWTTHASIVQYEGKWWLYYADAALSGQNNLRNTKVRELNFEDGTFSLVQPQPIAAQWVNITRTKRSLDDHIAMEFIA